MVSTRHSYTDSATEPIHSRRLGRAQPRRRIARVALAIAAIASAIVGEAEAAPPAPEPVRLERLGIDVKLPAQWRTLSYSFSEDSWQRLSGPQGHVSVRIEPVSVPCAEAMPGFAKLMGRVENKPGVVPRGFAATYLVYDPEPGMRDIVACADVPGGLLLAKYESNTSKLRTEIANVLSAVLAGARAAPAGARGGAREVMLAGFRTRLRLPATGGEWAYLDVPGGGGPVPGLVRLRPKGQPIAVTLRPDTVTDCKDKGVARPPFMPPRFHVMLTADNSWVQACTPMARSSIRVVVEPGTVSDADVGEVRTVLDALALAVGLSEPREAEPTKVVRLPHLGVEVALPYRDAEWELESTTSFMDKLKRSRPQQPLTSIIFSRENGALCSSPTSSEREIIDRPAAFPESVPPKIERQVRDRIHSLGTCLPTPTGSVLVVATSLLPYGKQEPAPEDLASIGAAIRAVAAAVGADKAQPAAPAAPKNDTAKLVLTELGVEIPASDGVHRWHAQTLSLNNGGSADLVRRLSDPGVPLLSVRLDVLNHRCASTTGTSNPRARMTTDKPAFVPPGYADIAFIEEPSGDSRVGSGFFCADLPDGRMLEALVVYNGSLWLPDAAAAGHILSSALAAVREKYKPAVATPSPGSTPPVSRPTSPRYSAGLDGPDGPGFGPTRASLSAYRLTPDDERLDGVFGGMLRLEGMTPSSDSDGMGFATEWSVGAGYDANGYFGYELAFALGFHVGLGPVLVAPLVGLGIDGTTGSDEAAYHLPSGGFYSFGARARVLVGDDYAVDLGGNRRMRSSSGDTVTVAGASVPIDGSKVTNGRLDWVFRGDAETALGVRYTGYGDATQVVFAMGRSF